MSKSQPVTWEELRLVSSEFFSAPFAGGRPVLSIYLDVPPEVRHQRRRWQTTLNSGISELRSRHRDDRALERLSAEVGRELLELKPEVRACSLVCLASVGGWRWTRTLRVPTGNHFAWGRLPVLGPLVCAIRSYPGTGMVVLAQDRARLMSWHQGLLSEETVLEADLDTGDWRRYAGGATRTIAQQSTTHTDDFQARFEAQIDRFLRSLAAHVTRLGERHDWELLLTVAAPKLADALTGLLGRSFRNRMLPSGDVNLIQAGSESLAAYVRSAVAEWTLRHRRQEASEAVEMAMSRGAAAAGPADCLNLLAQGRVQHLMYDRGLNLAGYRRDDGYYALYPDPRDPGAVPSDEVLEWAVAACLSTGALVTPLAPEAAGELSTVGGMVATLRR